MKLEKKRFSRSVRTLAQNRNALQPEKSGNREEALSLYFICRFYFFFPAEALSRKKKHPTRTCRSHEASLAWEFFFVFTAKVLFCSMRDGLKDFTRSCFCAMIGIPVIHETQDKIKFETIRIRKFAKVVYNHCACKSLDRLYELTQMKTMNNWCSDRYTLSSHLMDFDWHSSSQTMSWLLFI